MRKICVSILLLFALVGTAAADDNIVILMDNSGSTGDYMQRVSKTRMEVAKEALLSVLSKVPPSTKVGLLTFNGWVYQLGQVQPMQLKDAIMKMSPGGNTPLYDFMVVAANCLLQEREKQGNVGMYKLLVITDGERTAGIDNVETRFPDGSIRPAPLNDIISRNIIVDVIGLDMRDRHSLKEQINGKYMAGDNPQSVTQAISQAVAEIGYGDTKDVSDGAFADIKDIPDSFVSTVIQGLTTFPNHPIGEKPPVRVVKSDGTVTYEQQTTSVLPSAVKSTGIGPFGWFLIICAVVFVIVLVVVIITHLSDNTYY